LLGHSAATRPAPPPLPALPALPAAPPSRIGYLSRASSTELLRSADASQSPKSISQTLSLPPPHGDGLLATLRLPFVGSMAIAYALLKPTRSTLHFWLPFFMRTGHGYSEAAVASCLMLYDLGGLVGGVLFASALDYLNIGQLFASLAVLLAVMVVLLTSTAVLGPLPFGALLFLIGATFGGLELMSSGSAAGCIVDAIGSSGPDAMPAIVGAVNGLGSLAALFGVSFVPAALDVLGWDGLFQVCGGPPENMDMPLRIRIWR